MVKDVTRKWLWKTSYIGTLKKNKADIPREFLPAKTREVYSTLFDHTEKLTLLSCVPKKSNTVCFLSTMSHNRSITEEEDKKPQIILDYNNFKGGVDTMDHLATNYSCIRNNIRWPMTLFFNMLDVGAIASYVLWITFYPESLPKTTAKRKIFLLRLNRELVAQTISVSLQNPPIRAEGGNIGFSFVGLYFTRTLYSNTSSK
jgi:hypothetical protein